MNGEDDPYLIKKLVCIYLSIVCSKCGKLIVGDNYECKDESSRSEDIAQRS